MDWLVRWFCLFCFVFGQLPRCDRPVFIGSRSTWVWGCENCSCCKTERSRILRFVRRFQSNDRRCNRHRIRTGRWCSRDRFEVESDKFHSDCQTVDACTACALTSTNHRPRQRSSRVRATSTTAGNRNPWRNLVARSTTKSTDSTWPNSSHRGFRQV